MRGCLQPSTGRPHARIVIELQVICIGLPGITSWIESKQLMVRCGAIVTTRVDCEGERQIYNDRPRFVFPRLFTRVSAECNFLLRLGPSM